MHRRQLYEFEDAAWFPAFWRDMMTDFMSFFAVRFKVFWPIVPRVGQALMALDCRTLVDLCSGGSGPILWLLETLEDAHGCRATATLTDKFPNLAAFKRRADESGGALRYAADPVDATDVPPTLTGFRTLFTAFHHFPPSTARRILADAVAKREGIGIFEYTERTPVWAISLLVTPLLVWCVAPFAYRPFTWRHLVWTYLLPLPLLFMVLDGFASCARTYSPGELRELVRSLGDVGFVWDVGRIRSFGGCHVTYLIGVPHRGAADRRSGPPPAIS